MSTIAERFSEIQAEVQRASRGRKVKIIGVTKTVSSDRIAEAHRAGILVFGENRIQEGLPKIKELFELHAEWHFIGHLQTNKAKEAVANFACIQSVDSQKLLQQIQKEAAKQEKRMDVLLELNLGGEESKNGMNETELPKVLEFAQSLQNIRVLGLMLIPPFLENAENARPYFRRLRELGAAHQLPELSMGMSHDYVVAVEEGATMIRVGTALFGERS